MAHYRLMSNDKRHATSVHLVSQRDDGDDWLRWLRSVPHPDGTLTDIFLDGVSYLRRGIRWLGVDETHVVRTGRKPPVHRRLTEWLTVTVNRRYTAGFLLISAGSSTVHLRQNNFQLSKSW
jgi:hypothetical protein